VDLLLAFVIAMSVTMALIPMLMRLAERFQVIDLPEPRKVHSRPIPRIGGVAMVAGAVAPLLYWLQSGPTLHAYLLAALLVVGFGVWDDRATLGYLPKFFGQLLAAFIVVTWGGVTIHSLTLTERMELPAAMAVPLTVLFIVGITNAINLADGLDGLAGGTTLLSCCAIALLGLGTGDRFVTTVAIILSGSLLGFLRYNTYPARVFMGDGGSQFLGFTVAVIAVLLTQVETAPFSTALPLLLLGVPIIDTLMVMAQRIREGRSPFSADKNHIHHRLLSLGFDHHEAVIVIYLLQGALLVTAWLMRYESDLSIGLVFAAYSLLFLGSLTGASHTGWRWRAPDSVRSDGFEDTRRRSLRALRELLPRWSIWIIGAGTALYALYVASAARPIPVDVGWLCFALAVVLVAAGLFGAARSTPDWILHGSLYVCAVVLVFLDLTTGMGKRPVALEMAATSVLAASVMVYVRMTTVRRFRLTPLDFLVILVAVTLPNLPGSVAAPRELGLAAVKLLIVFYAVEMLLGHSRTSRVACHSLAILTVSVIAWRAL
jgi:UDP-GlcNAc:undecaprenyl-phosphate/decaprenyl-phosphate GlcNAc-1-phosphate transferase